MALEMADDPLRSKLLLLFLSFSTRLVATSKGRTETQRLTQRLTLGGQTQKQRTKVFLTEKRKLVTLKI